MLGDMLDRGQEKKVNERSKVRSPDEGVWLCNMKVGDPVGQ